MSVTKKIVNGVVVEVPDDNEMVKTIENGIVVEKPFSDVKKKDAQGLPLLYPGQKGQLSADLRKPGISSETIDQTIFDKPLLDRDIENKLDLTLSNPEYNKPEDRYSLSNEYYKRRQLAFDQRKEVAKSNIKKDKQSLSTYSQQRIGEINADVAADNQRLKEVRSKLGGVEMASPEELLAITSEQDRLNKRIALAEDYKQKLKSSIANEAVKKVSADFIGPGKTFDPRQLGREIIKISDPELELQYQDAEKGNSGLPQLQAAAMERLGLDAAKNYLQTQPDSDIKRKTAANIADYENDFDKRNFELTAQRVREKLGVYFYNKGLSGVFGYKTKDIEKAINDPESGLTDVEKQIANEYILPTEKKLYFSTEIPGSGFLRSGKDAIERSLVGLGNTISAQVGTRTDPQRAYENLNAEIEQSRFRRPGESPMLQQELSSLKRKEVESGLTEDETAKKNELEKLVDVRSNWAQFRDGVGDLTGQVIQMALLTKGVGAAGRAATIFAEGGGLLSGGLTSSAIGTSLSNETVGLFLNSYFQTYDNYRAQALQIMPGDKNAGNRQAYAMTMAAMEGFSERIFNDTKVLQSFTKGIAPSVADITSKFINKEISQQVARQELSSAFVKFAKPFAKEFAKSTYQESFEEGIVDIADGIAQSIFGDQPFDVNKTGAQAINTFLTTALFSPLVSGMAAHGHARQNANESAFYKAALVDMGRNPVPYLNSVDQLLLNGTISQDQANEKVKLIKSAQKYLSEIPKTVMTTIPDENGNGFTTRQLDFPEISSYMVHRMNEGILNEQLEKAKQSNDPVAEKSLQAQIDRSVEIRQGIADGQIAVSPNNIEITDNEKKAADLNIATPKQVAPDDLIGTKFQGQPQAQPTPEQTIIDEANKGGLIGPYNDLVKADPNLAKDVLLDYARQKYSLDQQGNVNKGGGREITNKAVDAAVTAAFPSQQAAIEAIKGPAQQINLPSADKLMSEKLPFEVKYKEVSFQDAVTGQTNKMSVSKAKRLIEKRYETLDKFLNCLSK